MFTYDEVVILTKAQREAREKAVKVGMKYYKSDVKRMGSFEIAMAYEHMCDLPSEVLEALDALDKGNNERGL